MSKEKLVTDNSEIRFGEVIAYRLANNEPVTAVVLRRLGNHAVETACIVDDRLAAAGSIVEYSLTDQEPWTIDRIVQGFVNNGFDKIRSTKIVQGLAEGWEAKQTDLDR